MNEILKHYLIAMLWAETDSDGNPLDENYEISDVSEEAIQASQKDIDTFLKEAGDLVDGLDITYVAHDVWLTRNRHGAGFWDRGYGATGDKLTEIAHKLGEVHPYVGDDGKIYLG